MMISYSRKGYVGSFVVFVAVLVLGGCAPVVMQPSEPLQAQAVGPIHSPRIDDGFAVSSLWGGETWRIYLRGSDPDGDMKHLWVVITQLGVRSDTEIVPLVGPDRAEFSGFLTLNTPSWIRTWENVRVEVRIRDQAGNLSEKATFEAQIGFPTRETLPPQWAGSVNRHLGHLFFNFIGDGGDNRPFGIRRGL
jgi:hypothetical protein